MSRLPVLKPQEVLRALERAGFQQKRQSSHVFVEHPDGRATVVPMHAGQDIDRGLLAKILRDIEMDADTFRELL